MRRRRFTIGLILLGCVVAGVGLAYQRGKIPDLRVLRADSARSKVDKRVIDADNRFAIKLFKECVKEGKGKNVIISPTSISMALSMVYNGAAGDTLKAMEDVLEFKGIDEGVVNASNSALMTVLTHTDRGVSMSLANSLWIDDTREIVPSFTDLMTGTYRADVGPLSVPAINGWVEKNTRGEIKEFIKGFASGSMMVLVNTIYFKGGWQVPFPKDRTEDGFFTLASGKKVRVPMMHNLGDYTLYWDKDVTGVRLDYGTGNVSAYVLRPKEGMPLKSFCRDLSDERLDKMLQGFEHVEPIELSLPRFRLEYPAELDVPLISLGMGVAFTPGKADFTRMVGGGAWITKVLHKAIVDVDERGTIAVAATEVEMGWGGGPSHVALDRPFLFLIRDDQTGLILFMGAVEDPRG